MVYRARDRHNEGKFVAVKVSKFSALPTASSQHRHIYALHREARWSLECLHNKDSMHYELGGAILFAKYLEDHTGFEKHSPGTFKELREKFEEPKFNWSTYVFDPPLAGAPYVVIEFIDGVLLQQRLEPGPGLDKDEQKAVVRQCTKALVYLERFSVVHRDFRGCNIFLVGKGARCRIKVIDLGFMVDAVKSHEHNPNPAVRCAWQGDSADKRVRFDWAPPEVRLRNSPNFGDPPTSFDVYSFGLLVLKLLRGRVWTQDAIRHDTARQLLLQHGVDVVESGLTVDILCRMVDQVHPGNRPTATEVLAVLNESRTKR